MTETKSQSHLDNNTILICRPGNRIVWYISDVVVPWVQYWVFFFQWLRRFRSADVCIRRMMGLNSCSHRAEKRTVWKEIWEPDAADEKLVQFKICEPFRRSPRSFSSSETLRGIAYQKDSQRGGKGGGSSAPPHQLLSPHSLPRHPPSTFFSPLLQLFLLWPELTTLESSQKRGTFLAALSAVRGLSCLLDWGGTERVSGDVCDESDSGLDVLAAKWARF